MKNNQIFKRYHSRLVRESVLKSVVYGLIVGLAAAFAISLVSWFFGYKGIWLAIGGGILLAAASSVLLYFIKYRPTAKDIARRVDGLGLEERVLTMMELENDESYIAMRQREDAKQKIAEADHKAIKIRLAKKAVALVCAAAVLASGMAVVSELAVRNVIKSGIDIFNPVTDEYFEITYEAEEGGVIEGEEVQIVGKGDNASPVVAIADDGYVFVEWSDGNGDPFRWDMKVKEKATYTAIFEAIDEDGNPDGDGDGNGNGEGMPSDMPGSGEGNGNGNGNGNQNGNGNGNGNGDGMNQGASGQSLPKNQILDGNTFYFPLLDSYMSDAAAGGGDGSVPSIISSIISTYFGSL